MALAKFDVEFGTMVERVLPFLKPNFGFGMAFGTRVDFL